MRDVEKLFRLDGRVALVTGGSGRIGTSLCHGLAGMGATVVCASRKIEACREVAEAITAAGGKALALPLDLADPQSVAALHEAAEAETGGVDILINNAVSQFPGPLEDYPLEDWEASMAIDATGYFRITQLFLNDMVARGRGNIISVASVLGMVGPDERLYPATGAAGYRPNYFFVKAGVVGFTRYLAVTYADRGIRANCISPGGVRREPPPPGAKGFIDQVPMKRIAHPDEMIGAAVYLASDASAYVTGHNLVVDGGYTAW